MLARLKSRKFWLSTLQMLLLISVIGFVVALYQQRDMISGAAPNIEAELVSGQPFSLGKALADGPVLIYFWGSWCPVCSVVSPAVNALAADHNVLSIALSSGSDAEISAYLNQHGYHFDTLNDRQGQYSEQWGVMVTPSLFIVNQRGKISHISTGVTTAWGLRLRLWLAGLDS